MDKTNVTQQATRADWAICDEDGVCDRYYTEEEARAALAEGGYPQGCYIEFVEDPGELA